MLLRNKRVLEPTEAPPKKSKRVIEHVEASRKKPRGTKRSQAPDPNPQPTPADDNEEEPGRPELPDDPSQAESHRSPHVQLPPEQPDQRAKLHPRPKRNARNVRPPPEQPDSRARRHQPVNPNPPQAQLPPNVWNKRLRPKVHSPNQPGPSRAEPADPEPNDSDASTCYSQSPEHYDVEQGVKAVGVPEPRDIELWGSTPGAAQFIRSQSGLEQDWIGVRPLGKGGNGIAGLWERRGDDGQVIDVRIRTRQSVVKILMISQANCSQRGEAHKC